MYILCGSSWKLFASLDLVDNSTHIFIWYNNAYGFYFSNKKNSVLEFVHKGSHSIETNALLLSKRVSFIRGSFVDCFLSKLKTRGMYLCEENLC